MEVLSNILVLSVILAVLFTTKRKIQSSYQKICKGSSLRVILSVTVFFFAILLTACEQGAATNASNAQAGAENEREVKNDDTLGYKQLEVHFIDVGQGAAQLIIMPNKKVMVIDGGNNDDEERMVAYLKEQGIKKVDILIGTHPDADHIGGIDAVIDAFSIGQVYMPKIKSNTKTFESVLLSLKKKGLKVKTAKAGVHLDLDENVSIKMIAPREQINDTNEMSAVVRMEYGNQSFLFMGDAGIPTEEKLMASGEKLKSTVLLPGHHGSNHSSSDAFLRTVGAKNAVIQVGKNNSYGHPTNEVLERLAKMNTKIYRNDTDGTIVFTTDGQSIKVNKNNWTYKGTQNSTKPNEKDHVSSNDAASSKTIKATAKINNKTPNQNEAVTVTVKAVDEKGNAIKNAKVQLNLHFKSTDTLYESVTDDFGVATIDFRIGRAAAGFTVKGDITVESKGNKSNTSIAFTPK